ncbi:lysostaphin resistance A-like protein [Actibacterium sp. D379-3]
MRYAPYERLVAPARARCEIWRTVAGYLLASSAQTGLIFALYALAVLLVGEDRAESAYTGIFFSTLTTTDTLLMLGSYGFLLVGVVLVVTQLHKRPVVTLIGPPHLALHHFLRCARALAVLYVAMWLLLPGGNADLHRNLAFNQWLLVLPLSLSVLLVQTGAEEVLFRGYLQQQFAARFASPVIWMGVPALIFAWGHYSIDQAGQNAAYTAIWAGLFALAASDLTARTGTLGAAVALHFINNVGAILFVSLPGPVSGLSLYTYPFGMDSPQIQPYFAIDLAMLFVSWLTARVALRV